MPAPRPEHERLTVVITAISLDPLPSGPHIRGALLDYLDARPRPGDVLRDLAARLDAAEDAGARALIPGREQPIREADELLPDYREQAHRRPFRLTKAEAARLHATARATGLYATSIIRAALAHARHDP